MPVVHTSDSLVTRNLRVDDLLKLGVDAPLELDEHSSSPSTPSSGNVRLYAKSNGRLYMKDDAGTETPVGIAAQYKTGQAFIFISAPTASDSFPVSGIPKAATITAVRYITSAGTVDFNLEERAEATPFSAGTDVFTSDKQATTTSVEATTFANAALAADTILFYAASAVSSPTNLLVVIDWTIDD